jgi:glutamate carboxypeptidase
MNPKESLAYFNSKKIEMLELLLKWVQIESPTTSKEAVDIFGKEVATAFSDIGMTVELDRQNVRGDHLVARWTGKGDKVLILGHLDTVWELGIFERMPIRVEGDLAYGPGIFDMKGGIVIALYALQLLRQHGFHHRPITVLLDTDEEEGSETSRDLIEEEATNSKCVLVLEPAGPNNGVKTKRRGTGNYNIIVHGKSAHAGVEPEKGVNAIEELSHQILEIQSWNKQRSGISTNVGIIRGGTRTNVVPDRAEAEVDVRVDAPEDVTWLREKFQSLTAKNPNAKVEVIGDVNRPPLVRSESVLNLYGEVSQIATAFDYPVVEYWTGGASDGNFTSAMGIPTIDGLGAEGAGAHALHEQIIVSSLPKRANLMYQFLRKLAVSAVDSNEP